MSVRVPCRSLASPANPGSNLAPNAARMTEPIRKGNCPTPPPRLFCDTQRMFISKKARRRIVRKLADVEAHYFQLELAQDGIEWEPSAVVTVSQGEYTNTFTVDGREQATDLAIDYGSDLDISPVAGIVAAQLFADTVTRWYKIRGGNTDLAIADASYAVRVLQSYLRHARNRPDLATGAGVGLSRLESEIRNSNEDP